MGSQFCSYAFRHPGRPRPRCDLPASDRGRCIFHGGTVSDDFEEQFLKTLVDRDHWLEGAVIHIDLRRAEISNAKLPYINFEGVTLQSVAFYNTLLEGANFRNCTIMDSIFRHCELHAAVFDRAILGQDKCAATIKVAGSPTIILAG